MKLIIFDLDQTIIELFKFHNKTTELIFKRLFNKKAKLDEIDFAGNTIKRNLITLARLKGIKKSEINRKIPKAIKIYGKIFISILPKNIRKFLLPEVQKLIKNLSKDKNNFLILLTGDSKVIAKAVLRRAKILIYFHFLATGEHTRSRTKMMRKAVKKAHKETGQKRFEKIIIIGDSIHDIKAGKAVGALTICVLTGFDPKSKLKKEGANYIFKNLKNSKLKNVIPL